MAVTRIVANLSAADPVGLARFYETAFELDLRFDMGWIAFLTNDSTLKIELHTASHGGSGTELPVISIGVEDLEAAEAAVRAAGGGKCCTARPRNRGDCAGSFSAIQPAIW